MLEQIAGFLGSGNMVVLLNVFVVFMVVAFKVFRIVIRTATIAIIAALFPFVARFIFNMDIPITVNSVLWFVITAIGLYFVYFLVRGGYKLVHFAFGGKKKKK